MKILFIDTSSKNIVLALIDNNKTISYINEINNNKLSDRIFPLLIKLFNKVNYNINSISKIYVVNGPGSFTGVRVGVTIAKTMAWALNIPVIPVSSLEVLATTPYNGDYLIPYIDARRGYIYGGIYDTKLNKIFEDTYGKLSDFSAKILDDKRYNLVGYDDIETTLEKLEPNIDLLKVISKHENEIGINPHILSPNYLKRTEAEENLEK